jgi:hypothetical protein
VQEFKSPPDRGSLQSEARNRISRATSEKTTPIPEKGIVRMQRIAVLRPG